MTEQSRTGQSEEGERITAAGQILAQAWETATTIGSFPEGLFPRDVAQAIAIQDEMARRIGDEVVGWKVAGRPGPLVGRIFAPTLFANPATLPLTRFPAPSIECELAFRLLQDLPPRGREYGREEVLGVARLVLTLEIVGRRFTDGKPIPDTDEELREIIADNAANAGLVVGPEIPDWRSLSLLDITVDLRIDGGSSMPLQAREGRNNPDDILVWLVNDLSARGIGIKAGQVVTTGSATILQPLACGSTAVAVYEGLGELRVTLTGS